MKKLNKILIVPIILACSIFSTSLADDSDCWKFGGMIFNGSYEIVDLSRWTNSNRFTNFLSIPEQNAIITKNDLNTALLNLKKYCCDNDKWDLSKEICEKDAWFYNSNVLDSPYLFDHIFDVIMRRLNWQNGDINIYTATKMSLDDKWSERRTWIDEQAQSTDWSNPEIIINKYKKFWEQNQYNITSKVYSTFWELKNEDFLKYVSWGWGSDDSKFVANSLKEYNERTLYDRYINSCALSEYFYALLDLGVDSSDKNKTIHNLAQWSCDNIVKREINWENTYVALVTQRSSNLFLSNYIDWYFSYLYERQQKFQKLRKDTTDRRFDIIKAVPCLQHVCNKW